MKRLATALLAIAIWSPAFSDRMNAADADSHFSGIRTNWSQRWITNTAEITLQLNKFVTEYHTNLVTQIRTNFVDLYSTNIVVRTLTNQLFVESIRTNFVLAYRTNLETLHLTNWTTVVAFKTNWINQPLTNLVEVNLPREQSPAAAPVAKSRQLNEPLSLHAARGSQTAGGSVEVQLKVTWVHEPDAPIQVQQWRIERDDGSILCFGQDSEFKRALPVGTYKVTVRAQREAKGPLLAALATLTVSARDVSIEQRPARSSSSI